MAEPQSTLFMWAAQQNLCTAVCTELFWAPPIPSLTAPLFLQDVFLCREQTFSKTKALYGASGEPGSVEPNNENVTQLSDLTVHAQPWKNYQCVCHSPILSHTSSMVARISEITEKKRMHWSFSLAKDFYLTVLTEANKSLNYWNENLNPSLLLSLLPCSL